MTILIVVIVIFVLTSFQAADLRRLTTMYKEWAFQLFPNLAFEDLLSSTEKLGSKGKVRHVVNELREIERRRYMVL